MRVFLQDLWHVSRRDKLARIGGVVIVVYVFIAIFGPMITHVTAKERLGSSYLGPSLAHPLGTDFLGRGVLSELIVGTRPIMEIAVLSALMTVTTGVVVGLMAGYMGGAVDAAVMRVVDVFLTIPALPLIIVIASVIHTTNPVVLAAILSVVGWSRLARAVRAQALSLRSSGFVEAARIQGLPLRNVIGRQLLPNVGPYVAMHGLLDVTGAIYAEVGLFLLGIAPISGINWGTMINQGMAQGAMYTSHSALALFAPMGAIVVLQVALVSFARALDAVFNPRLRAR